jgi:hypothetical protein
LKESATSSAQEKCKSRDNESNGSGTGYYDVFYVNVANAVGPDDPNDPIESDFSWGGQGYDDGSLETNSGSSSIHVNSLIPQYLTVGLRTDGVDPSWGTITFTSPNPLPIYDPPAAPSHVTARQRLDGDEWVMDVVWADHAHNEDGFIVERYADGIGWSPIGVGAEGWSTAENTIIFTDTDADPGVPYRYRVKAINDSGTSNASEESGNVAIALPSVYIEADLPSMSESPGDWGQFLISRTGGDLSRSLTVPLTILEPDVDHLNRLVEGEDIEEIVDNVEFLAGHATAYLPALLLEGAMPRGGEAVAALVPAPVIAQVAPAPAAVAAPAALSAKQLLMNMLQAEEAKHRRADGTPYAYASISGLMALFVKMTNAILPNSFTVTFNPTMGPMARVLNGNTMEVKANLDSTTAFHEMVHVLQFQGGFGGGFNRDEREAWVAQTLLVSTAFLRNIENGIPAGDPAATIAANWRDAWGPQGLPSAIGVNNTYGVQTAQDVWNVSNNLGLRFSSTVIGYAYNQTLKAANLIDPATGGILFLTAPAALAGGPFG